MQKTEIVELRRIKRARVPTSFGSDFITSFVVKKLEEIDYSFVVTYIIEEDPKTYEVAMRFVVK